MTFSFHLRNHTSFALFYIGQYFLSSVKMFHVGPSSVCKGKGLYTKVEIKRGTVLPGYYKGLNLSPIMYACLVDDLQQGAPRDYTDEFIEYIQSTYGLQIVPADTDHIGPSSVDWKGIADGVTSYAYEHDTYEKHDRLPVTRVTVLPVYDTDGKPELLSDNLFLLCNEPPAKPYFYNTYSGKTQKSAFNLMPVTPQPPKDGQKVEPYLQFKATRDISAGEELQICYNGAYQRDYEINMSADCGCGAYSQVGIYLNMSERQFMEKLSKYNRVPKHFFRPDALSDKRTVAYLEKITR